MVNILDYFQLILDSFNFIFLFPQQSLPPRRLPRRSQSCGSGEVGCGGLRSGRSEDSRRGQGSLRHAPAPRRPPQPRAHRYARTRNSLQHVRNVPFSSEYPFLPVFHFIFSHSSGYHHFTSSFRMERNPPGAAEVTRSSRSYQAQGQGAPSREQVDDLPGGGRGVFPTSPPHHQRQATPPRVSGLTQSPREFVDQWVTIFYSGHPNHAPPSMTATLVQHCIC